MSREIEDGMGFSGLVPSKEEKYITKLEQENKKLRKCLLGIREYEINRAIDHHSDEIDETLKELDKVGSE